MIASLPLLTFGGKQKRLDRRKATAAPGASVSAFVRQRNLERKKAAAVGRTEATRTSQAATRYGAGLAVRTPTLTESRTAASSGLSAGAFAVPTGAGPLPAPVVAPSPLPLPAPAPPAPITIVPEYEAAADAMPETEALTLPTGEQVKTAVSSVPSWVWIAAGVVAIGGVALLLARAD